MYFDAHNHLQQLPDPDDAIRAMRGAGITGCVVNGTREEDWDTVATLALRHPDFIIPAFGLHPWYAHHRSPDWLDRLQRHLDRFPSAWVGECGVDGWIEGPPLDVQSEVFLPQLKLARERSRPVAIHALKAWEPLFEALRDEAPPAGGFLMHSFGGSAETAARLARIGARFSFSGHFLHPRKAPLVEVFRGLPSDRLLLETDAPSMPPPAGFLTHPLPGGMNHPANLAAIARGLADRLGEDPERLARRCLDNTRDFLDNFGC